jgi:cytochrome P450
MDDLHSSPAIFLTEEFRNNPYPILENVASQNVVCFDPILVRWWVLSYEEAERLLRDSRQLCHDLTKADDGTASHSFAKHLGEERFAPLFQDPPFHTRLRRAMAGLFTLGHINTLRPMIEQHVGLLLSQLPSTGTVDLVRDYISPLTIRVISDLIGVSAENTSKYFDAVDKNNLAFSTALSHRELDDVREAQQFLRSCFLSSAKERLQKRQEDIISALLWADTDFTEDQVAIVCQFLVRAGNLTSTDLISNCIHSLLCNRSELRKLQINTQLLSEAVEETLRYDSPALEAGRITTGFVEIKDTVIVPGQTLMISLAYANHDTSRFPNPHLFDITRKDKKHLSFGGGVHFCLGAWLARAEAELAVGRLLEKFPDMRLHPTLVAQRHLLPSFRGFRTLPVILS